MPAYNTPVDTSVTADIQNYSGKKETFICLAYDPDAGTENTLGASDLVPRTSNSTYPSVSRNVTDVPLDGGDSTKVVDAGSTYGNITSDYYGAASNAKWLEIEQAADEGLLIKFHTFAPDESGWRGLGYITETNATDDSGFHYSYVISPILLQRTEIPES